tara:strand:- start:1274 stop:2305 length:1032 start_codon:yes stop_codon:yes gene_type:complete
MDIKKVVNPNDYEVGVIIGRFQVHKLHSEQRKMVDIVCKNHKKVIIFLGISKSTATRRQPLDFATRQAMVQKHYPNVIILPLYDQRKDEVWSKILDQEIAKPFGSRKTLLYGSRDSFIPHYKGRHATTELTSDYEVSGTEIRNEVSKEILSSANFRAGIIHSVYAKYPSIYPTVDVCAYNGEGQILLVKKPGEDYWRFPGGFVDATDLDLERAARREFSEEVNGCHINSLKYVLSQKVDDWRYKKEVDGIMTTLFIGGFGFGQVKPTDDLEGGATQWFDISIFTNPEKIVRDIMVEHHFLMAKLVQKVYEDELIPNLGGFFKYKQTPKDPETAQPSEFEIKLG